MTKGKIVVIASSASWLNAPRLSFYNVDYHLHLHHSMHASLSTLLLLIHLLQASKAAVVSFFETLRVEFGSDINITLVNPGLIESEMTKGKFLNKEGRMVVDQDIRDVVMSAVPIEMVGRCAEAIVKSACRGDKYLTWPPWMNSVFLVKTLCPQVVDWFNRWYLLTEAGVPPTEAISKKVIDLPGLKDMLWPHSLRSPKIKTN
jgi:short-subunit dehydrogenase